MKAAVLNGPQTALSIEDLEVDDEQEEDLIVDDDLDDDRDDDVSAVKEHMEPSNDK